MAVCQRQHFQSNGDERGFGEKQRRDKPPGQFLPTKIQPVEGPLQGGGPDEICGVSGSNHANWTSCSRQCLTENAISLASSRLCQSGAHIVGHTARFEPLGVLVAASFAHPTRVQVEVGTE